MTAGPIDREPDARDPDLRVGVPARQAAGIGGVVHGLAPIVRDVGIRRGVRALRALNQPDGFDCPGCAWPDPARGEASHAEFCENGAKAVAYEADRRRCGPDVFAAHTLEDLATRDDHWLGSQGRLTTPMHRAPGSDRYVPISWDDAFAVAARHLGAVDPDAAVFYTSGRTSNEAAFLYQLLARAHGTNNLPDCSNMCHESSGSALGETIGIGKGSVRLSDFDHAEVILVLGQNPGTNHPRMLTALERAKERGAVIVAINPLPEAGLIAFANPQRVGGVLGRATPLADRHLAVKIGGDLGLLRLVNAGLLARGAVDRRFVDEHCDGFEALAAELAALADLSGEEVDRHLAAAGLPVEDVEWLTDLLARSERIIACWAMGLTQHKASVPTIRELTNTLLLRGAIGRPGAGACPVRGHSNVQGDRTMGINEKAPAAFLEALEAEFGLTVPRAHGLDTVAAIEAMEAGRVRVFVGLGGNFAAATPDTTRTEAALARCALTVQVSTKLNRSHVVCGQEALILPCLGRSEVDRSGGIEQTVTVEDSMGEVHVTRGVLEPASPLLRSEVSIVCGLGAAVVGSERIPWEALAADHDRVRDRIAAVVPGFDDFRRRLVDGDGRFELPHPPRDERRFDTRSGRAQLSVNPLQVIDVPPGRLLLQTVRSHDQYNTTIYGFDDRYRGIRGGRRVVFVNPDDLAELGIADGAMVDLVGEWGDGRGRVAPGFRVVGFPIARGCAASYFPETNVLVPLESVADVSNTPTSKSVVIRLLPTL